MHPYIVESDDVFYCIEYTYGILGHACFIFPACCSVPDLAEVAPFESTTMMRSPSFPVARGLNCKLHNDTDLGARTIISAAIGVWVEGEHRAHAKPIAVQPLPTLTHSAEATIIISSAEAAQNKTRTQLSQSSYHLRWDYVAVGTSRALVCRPSVDTAGIAHSCLSHAWKANSLTWLTFPPSPPTRPSLPHSPARLASPGLCRAISASPCSCAAPGAQVRLQAWAGRCVLGGFVLCTKPCS